MYKYIIFILLFLSAYGEQSLQALSTQNFSNGSQDERIPNSFIVRFNENISQQDQADVMRTANAQGKMFRSLKAAVVTLESPSDLSRLESDERVAEVIPNRVMRMFGSTETIKFAKPGTNQQSQVNPAGVQRIGALGLAYTGTGIGVAVVDTGVDMLNADLKVSNACFTAYDSCQDGNGHGTGVAGIIGAKNNNIDSIGVAPAATIYAVRVLNSAGSGSDADIIEGLDWIASNANLVQPAIKAVNMSLGRAGSLNDNSVMRDAVKALKDLGIVIVVAAGNDVNSEVSGQVPATYPEVFAIASSTAKNGSNACKSYSGFVAADTASYYTTDGVFNAATKIGVTITAPGEEKEDISRSCFGSSVGVQSLKIGGGLSRINGTSAASPHVAGVVALLMQKYDGAIGFEDTRNLIRSTASRSGVAPLNSPFSSYTFDGEREGIVSACGALGATCQ